jgi:hypothetical protein
MPKPNLPFKAAVERRIAGPALATRRMDRVLWAHVVARSRPTVGPVRKDATAPSWRTVVRRSGIES